MIGNKIKKLISSFMVGLCLLGFKPMVNASVVSVDDFLRSTAVKRTKRSSGSFLSRAAFVWARAAILEEALDRIRGIHFIREIHGLGDSIDNYLRDYLLEILPEIDYELIICFGYAEDMEEIFRNLQNMRAAYIRIYKDYMSFYGIRHYSM